MCVTKIWSSLLFLWSAPFGCGEWRKTVVAATRRGGHAPIPCRHATVTVIRRIPPLRIEF